MESIRNKWIQANRFDKGATIPTSPQDVLQKSMNNAEKAKEQASAGAAESSSSGLKSERIFNMMPVYLARGEGKAEVAKVQSVFAF